MHTFDIGVDKGPISLSVALCGRIIPKDVVIGQSQTGTDRQTNRVWMDTTLHYPSHAMRRDCVSDHELGTGVKSALLKLG